MLIIFDLDDTLIDTSSATVPVKLKDALTKMLKAGMLEKVAKEKVSKELEDELFEELYEELLQISFKSKNGKDTLTNFCKTYDSLEFYEIGEKEYYENIDLTSINFSQIEFAEEVLCKLKDQGHTLVLVSHGILNQQLEKMKKAKIDASKFSKIYITEKHDKEKYYLIVLEEFADIVSVNHNCVFLIGDSMERDIIPANNLGIKTIHFRFGRGKNAVYADEFRPSFSINSLNEIIDIVNKVKKISKE